MRSTIIRVASATLALSLAACADRGATPTGPVALEPRLPALAVAPWGPETPPFNIEAVLRGDGFGLVKFRQPNDADKIVYLDVWVRDLTPNTDYLLQRAVDASIDDNCTSTGWLTLGAGSTPQAITTDATGSGKAQLWRNLGATSIGTEFDIHFRVINAGTSAVALTSDCYQFRVSQ
jgi:hypothetical protein